jgi:hypothetical protein
MMMKGVQVLVLDEKGKVMEKGERIKGKGDWWDSAPTTEGKVIVEARGLAGKVVREEL